MLLNMKDLSSPPLILKVLTKRGTIYILTQLMGGRKRFGDLYKEFKSPASLTRRVRDLERLGLIKREPDVNPDERGVFYYKITKTGRRFFVAYKQWAKAVGELLAQDIKLHKE